VSAIPVDHGTWFRWLADQAPARRTLTQEECHTLARDADRARQLEFLARDVVVSYAGREMHPTLANLIDFFEEEAT
jgi:hypothetical protein